jgi:8-hydroxy-5-deazaflavin:NADPH oxidoreductase
MQERQTIAVVGGTGAEGSGLALRLAASGHPVTIGSRSAERAETRARELSTQLGGNLIAGAHNRQAAAGAGIIILTVPYSAQAATVDEISDLLEGKILVDATVPLMAPKVGVVQLPENGSAVAAVQKRLGSTVRVVSAFQNVSAHRLMELNHHIECDVLVCGDDAKACETIIGLAADMRLRGLYAGPIANSVAAEALTSLLISINRRYKIKDSGIRITGLPES